MNGGANLSCPSCQMRNAWREEWGCMGDKMGALNFYNQCCINVYSWKKNPCLSVWSKWNPVLSFVDGSVLFRMMIAWGLRRRRDCGFIYLNSPPTAKWIEFLCLYTICQMAFYQRNFRLSSSYFLIKSPKILITSFEILDSTVNLNVFGGYTTVSVKLFRNFLSNLMSLMTGFLAK